MVKEKTKDKGIEVKKHYFVDECGNNGYKLDCGCEGIEINGKWKTILCEEHQAEEDEMLEEDPIKIRKVRKSEREY